MKTKPYNENFKAASGRRYDEDFKREIVRLHLSDRRSILSLQSEFGVSHGSIVKWCRKYRGDMVMSPKNADVIVERSTSPKKEILASEPEQDLVNENCRLNNEVLKLTKENLLLKQTLALFAGEAYGI